MLVDTHCHIEKKDYGNLNDLIGEIFKTDVKYLVVSGYDIESSMEAVRLSELFDNVYATVGFHPHESHKIKDEDYYNFDEWMKNPKVVGVGEIGLDFYYDKDTIKEQIEVFKRQLDIALKYNKPVVIHNRDASKEIYEIIKDYKVNGIIHCFNDDLLIAKRFIDLDFLLGVGGIITFKKNNLKDVIKDVPLEYIVLETDSPYLAPEPFRGKQNTPENLPIVAEVISKIKEVEYEEVARITTLNAIRLFDFEGNL